MTKPKGTLQTERFAGHSEVNTENRDVERKDHVCYWKNGADWEGNAEISGISECKWTGCGTVKTSTGKIIVHVYMYSGREDEHQSNGVAIVMTREASRSLSELGDDPCKHWLLQLS